MRLVKTWMGDPSEYYYYIDSKSIYNKTKHEATKYYHIGS